MPISISTATRPEVHEQMIVRDPHKEGLEYIEWIDLHRALIRMCTGSETESDDTQSKRASGTLTHSGSTPSR